MDILVNLIVLIISQHMCVSKHHVVHLYTVFICIHIYNFYLSVIPEGTSLVAQWLRIHLPMQGIRVRALAQEDPMY